MKDPVSVYIRPLRVEDAQTSFRWRNNPEVWKYTGSRPDRHITPEIETEWIIRVSADPTTARFAICIRGTDAYIGNVQLTEIDAGRGSAVFHIFIGEPEYWGRGIATQATRLLLEHARVALGLKRVILWVNPTNRAAVAVYRKCGFKTSPTDEQQMEIIFDETKRQGIE